MLALARLACDVPDDIDDAPIFAAIRSLLDAYDEFAVAEPDNRRRLAFLILAATVARTPEVPVPASAPIPLPDQPQPGQREQVVDLVDRLADERHQQPASPPVAITVVEAPSSARSRPTIPSTCPANP